MRMYRNASTLLFTEAPLSLKNILYGDIQENMTKTLITAVEKYICETQREFM